jgi:YD repeat-containing protein
MANITFVAPVRRVGYRTVERPSGLVDTSFIAGRFDHPKIAAQVIQSLQLKIRGLTQVEYEALEYLADGADSIKSVSNKMGRSTKANTVNEHLRKVRAQFCVGNEGAAMIAGAEWQAIQGVIDQVIEGDLGEIGSPHWDRAIARAQASLGRLTNHRSAEKQASTSLTVIALVLFLGLFGMMKLSGSGLILSAVGAQSSSDAIAVTNSPDFSISNLSGSFNQATPGVTPTSVPTPSELPSEWLRPDAAILLGQTNSPNAYGDKQDGIWMQSVTTETQRALHVWGQNSAGHLAESGSNTQGDIEGTGGSDFKSTVWFLAHSTRLLDEARLAPWETYSGRFVREYLSATTPSGRDEQTQFDLVSPKWLAQRTANATAVQACNVKVPVVLNARKQDDGSAHSTLTVVTNPDRISASQIDYGTKSFQVSEGETWILMSRNNIACLSGSLSARVANDGNHSEIIARAVVSPSVSNVKRETKSFVFDFDSRGELSRVIDQNGHVIRLERDGDGRISRLESNYVATSSSIFREVWCRLFGYWVIDITYSKDYAEMRDSFGNSATVLVRKTRLMRHE